MRVKNKFHTTSSYAGEKEKKKKKKKKKRNSANGASPVYQKHRPSLIGFMRGPACPVTKVKRPRYLDRAKVA